MIIDAISFFNELDLLELRLAELSPVVDHFVIVEATVTHKGTPKPLYYAENMRRFAEWEHQIVHIIVGDMPQGEGIAAIRRREMFQRNAILRGLRGFADDDIVMISDCDELPRANCVLNALPDGMIVIYFQKLHYYNINTFAPDRAWPGTRACRVADARALSPHIVRNGIGQPDHIYPAYRHIPDAGWHYSYFGGAAAVQYKMTEFLHQELVTDENTTAEAIAEKIASGTDIWGRQGEQEFVIGRADDLPYTILRDLPLWRHHFAPGWEPTFHEDWMSGGQALYLGQLARHAPDGAFVEIGAWEGRSAITLCQMVAPRIVTVIDHWRGNTDEGERHESTQIAKERDVFVTFRENMLRCTGGNYVIRRQSWQRAMATWDAPIAFLHLDASHDRESVRDCLIAVKPYLVDGAILCGDDAYAESVRLGVADVFPTADVIGGRMWMVKYHVND